jgi:hypothetical protein
VKLYRVWPKQGRGGYPVLELDRIADGWAIYLIVKRGQRRYAQTVDKERARALRERHPKRGDTIELLERLLRRPVVPETPRRLAPGGLREGCPACAEGWTSHKLARGCKARIRQKCRAGRVQ